MKGNILWIIIAVAVLLALIFMTVLRKPAVQPGPAPEQPVVEEQVPAPEPAPAE